jgi:large repetitive protein
MSIKYNFKYVFLMHLIFGVLLFGNTAQAQTETMSSGSFIINMGVTPQSINNALRPYGMIYDLTKNYKVPIRWVINPSKGKDGTDFTFNGVSYRGGPFIIPAEFRTAAVNSRITYWQGQGVQGVTTNAAVTVPVYAVIGTAVRWTLDATNGHIAIPYLDNAAIPSSAYGYKDPQSLNNCDDLYIMPHAEPTFASHSNLVTWNNTHRGSIWVGCKAGSETENNVGNFLSAAGVVPEASHGDLSGAVTYTFDADPVMQFLGSGAHLQSANGAEQIYYPNASGWRGTTNVGIYQTSPSVATNLRKALIAWGPGFGDSNRGWVCMHAGHSLLGKDKTGTINDNVIQAVRAFNNFSLLAAIKRTIYPMLTGVPNTINAGVGTPFSYTLTPPGGTFTTQWTSSCGGTFSPSATSANVTFTPPAGATSCMIGVTVSDACGRAFYTSKLITVQCVLNVTQSVANTYCFGDSNGSIAMTITGAAGPYNWNWSRVSPAGTGSGSGTTIPNLSAGSYNVTVTSPAGCQSTFTSIVLNQALLTASATAVNPACFGQTGSVNLNPSGGVWPYVYSWSGPSGFTATTQNISNRPAGTYNVTVTDNNGCTATASATITAPASAVSVVLTSKTDVNCTGQSTGAINITASGGTPGYSYSWNTGATSEDRTGLAAGTYSVTVTDSKGCTAALTGITINTLQNTNLTIATNNVSCAGGNNGNIQVTATGIAPFNINWSGPVTGNPAGNEIAASGGSYTISSLSAGSYSVTVSDANNCTSTFTRTITAPTALLATTAATNFACFGQTGAVSLTVTGGTAAYTYSWAGPSGFTATTQNITNRPAGTYTVTVTDANNCTMTAMGTITGPATAVSVVLTSKTDINCSGGNTGAINITAAGGTPGYTYLWNNGSTTEDRTSLGAGTYSVTVTDSRGCTSALTGVMINVIGNTNLTIATTNVSCSGGTNGSIQVTATGIAPFNINWTGPVSGNPAGSEIAASGGSYTIPTLSAGSYSVTVTDVNSCPSTFTRTITAPSAIVATTAVTNFACFGQTGGVSLTVSGGTPTYTYSWSGPSGFTATTQNISNRPAGTYNVTVTDSQNCTTTATATITGPTSGVSVVLTSKTDVNCLGQTTGAIDITASGGTPTYTYLWNTGATTQDRTGLGAGIYSVTVTDSQGCTAALTGITIGVLGNTNLAITTNNVTCAGGTNGSIQVTATGIAPFNINWTGPVSGNPVGSEIAASGGSYTISNLSAGTYNVTVNDNNSCATTFTRTVIAPTAIVATTAVSNFTCFGQTGGVTLTVAGGTPTYTYSWSGPSGFTATTQNISGRPAGTYNVTVTDSQNCTTTATATVTGPATGVSVVLTSKTDANCLGNNTGAINITVSGGTPTYTYLWNTGATTEDRTGLAPGIYSVTVADNNGCTAALTGITINTLQNTVLTITPTNVSCAGGTNGNILVAATGVAPFNINWTGPVSGNPAGNEIAASGGSYTLPSLSAGSYSVSVVDANSCTSTFTRTLTSPANLVAAAAVSSFPCFGQTGGVSLTVTGGTPTYTYSWSGPSGFTATTQNITNRPAGTYNVTVTDSQSCTTTATATITGPTSAVAIALDSKSNTTCNGSTNGIINITASGGTPGYTYAWSDGSTAQDRTGLAAGTYIVTVTDMNGCTGTRSETITQPNPIVLSLTKVDPTCPPGANPAINGNNGSINLTVSGGTSPYTYAWTTVGGGGLVPSVEDQIGLRTGVYTVLVTDINNCTATQSVTLVNLLPIPTPPSPISNN